MWIEAALKQIGRSGVDGVQVEVWRSLASPRAASTAASGSSLLDALLETRRGRVAAIEKQTELGGEDARERLRR